MKTQLLIHPEELSREWIRRAISLGVTVSGIHPVGVPMRASPYPICSTG